MARSRTSSNSSLPIFLVSFAWLTCCNSLVTSKRRRLMESPVALLVTKAKAEPLTTTSALRIFLKPLMQIINFLLPFNLLLYLHHHLFFRREYRTPHQSGFPPRSSQAERRPILGALHSSSPRLPKRNDGCGNHVFNSLNPLKRHPSSRVATLEQSASITRAKQQNQVQPIHHVPLRFKTPTISTLGHSTSIGRAWCQN